MINDYIKGHSELKRIFLDGRGMKNEEELQELVRKNTDDFAALNENESYAEIEKELCESLEQSRTISLS